MEETDNHGFQIWEYGERPWNHIDDFEALEELVIVRDIGSLRDNYEPYEGAIFLSTPNGAVYLGDGDEWEELGTLTGDLASSDNYVTVNDARGVRSEFRDSDNHSSGVCVRPTNNPDSGDVIFSVESTGPTTRFYVEHAGKTYVHDNLEVGGTINTDAINIPVYSGSDPSSGNIWIRSDI